MTYRITVIDTGEDFVGTVEQYQTDRQGDQRWVELYRSDYKQTDILAFQAAQAWRDNNYRGMVA